MIENKKNALIIGASRGIGFGFVNSLLQNSQYHKIYAMYRQQSSAISLLALAEKYPQKLICLQVDITEENQIISSINYMENIPIKLDLVINCVGVLHDLILQPEKSLKHINSENLLRYFQINTIPSILLLKHLKSLLKHQNQSVFATISAKVGSITDNQLGGWYGYRASKTALNMLMKTASIEYLRTNPKTIIVMLHPGTTNTLLSLPFQKNVPAQKLFSVDLCVQQLLTVIDHLTMENTGQFLSWDGSIIPF